jgi:hypothetical protein
MVFSDIQSLTKLADAVWEERVIQRRTVYKDVYKNTGISGSLVKTNFQSKGLSHDKKNHFFRSDLGDSLNVAICSGRPGNRGGDGRK